MDTVILVADAQEASGAAAEWVGLRARSTGPSVRILEFGDAPAGRSPAEVARDRIRELAPGTPVSVEHPAGHPVDVLCDLAGDATLIVVGGAAAERRGKPGSLAARLAGRIRCDLAVVPPGWHPDGGAVVAGWDDTPESAHALDRAADEARLLGADLQIVHTYLPPYGSPYDPAGWAVLSSEVRSASEGDLARATTRARRAHPDLAISSHLALGSPTSALLGAVASLIVVGTHHRNALSQVLLGTTDDNLARPVDEVPVLIVDHGAPTNDPAGAVGGHGVLVAVGAPDTARPAARYGAAEAEARGEPLTLLHVRTGDEPDPLPALAELLAREYPRVEVHTDTGEPPVPATIADRAAARALLVVGPEWATSPESTLGRIARIVAAPMAVAKPGMPVDEGE